MRVSSRGWSIKLVVLIEQRGSFGKGGFVPLLPRCSEKRSKGRERGEGEVRRG